ncbi:MAG: hypothetical protein GX496_12710, partial [Firmicutes bacterium]|nr:hypothetical protein [Bacillota bacterium]
DLARVLDPALVAVAGPVFSLGPCREAFDRLFGAGYARSDGAPAAIWVDLPALPPLGAASVAIQKVLFTGAYRDPTSHGLVAGYADEEE